MQVVNVQKKRVVEKKIEKEVESSDSLFSDDDEEEVKDKTKENDQ